MVEEGDVGNCRPKEPTCKDNGEACPTTDNNCCDGLTCYEDDKRTLITGDAEGNCYPDCKTNVDSCELTDTCCNSEMECQTEEEENRKKVNADEEGKCQPKCKGNGESCTKKDACCDNTEYKCLKEGS